MTVQQAIQVLEADGWRLVFEEEMLRQYRHDTKAGLITLAGGNDLRIPPGLLRTLNRYAQFEDES